MRSPAARSPVVHFCASCDGPPDSVSSARTARQQQPQSASTSSSSLSRSSTPPTEVSEASEFALPPETEQSRRRREQSDAASAAIGQRLLKGWAMLAEECPASTCFGVPLVRPPKVGGEKDPRMECVICGSVYLSEVDAAGRESLVVQNQTHAASEPPAAVPVQAPIVPQPSPPSSQPPAVLPSTAKTALEQSASSLEDALRVLTSRLTTLTAGQADSSSIANAADAITKIVQALTQLNDVQPTFVPTGTDAQGRSGFHSTPNLLDQSAYPHEPLAQSWTPPSALRAREFSENGSWRSYNSNTFSGHRFPEAQQPIGQHEPTSPAFGPRMEALFMERASPLSELADWTSAQSRSSRPLADLPAAPPMAEDWSGSSRRGSIASRDAPSIPEPIPHYRPSSPERLPAVVEPRREHRDRKASRDRDKDGGGSPGTYYIVPAGVNVIFQDQAGREITRVGDFENQERPTVDDRDPPRTDEGRRSRNAEEGHGRRRHHHEFRTKHRESKDTHRSHSPSSDRSYRSSEPTIILIDKYGRQIPITPYGGRGS
uniref:Uncharacterized protein n=1 Tax=Mycena chlorophos TaxID=658473 RepID=A0ABQ0LVU8_MYCCL|nr:predicted protein [Mycena chlorophos]